MPTVSERLAHEHPEEHERAAAWRERLVDVEVLETLLAPAPDVPPILGVGLTPLGGERAAAAVVVAIAQPTIVWSVFGRRPPELEPQDVRVAAALERAHVEIAERLGEAPDAVVVIGMPPPIEQVGPGEDAHCGGGPGSFGARVTTGAGGRGILTAGHAAPVPNAGAYDGGANLLGTVVETHSCASVAAKVETPDVAVVELDAHVPDTPTTAPAVTSAGTAGLWDTITAYGAVTQGVASSVVVAGTPFAGSNPGIGVYGEAIVTAYAISAGGDSGAPVYNQHGELVAHVVAGYPGVLTVAQDVTYQLRAVSGTLR